MKVVTAYFIRSANQKKDYPRLGPTEIAFAGRSNVGKSSAINTLLARHNLVPTSKSPGRTRKLNFYMINDRFIFVDLPGYGYAEVPAEIRKKWAPMIEEYLSNTSQLAGVVAFVDARRPPTDSDMALVEYLKSRGIPAIVAATKADKLSRTQAAASKRQIMEKVGEDVPVVLFSSLNGMGKKELWKEIKSLIEAMSP
jgi:GTP-binding protein